MGIYCNLFIGSTEFSWKGTLPEIISILFEPEDYVTTLNNDNETNTWYEHEFISTCGKISSRLQNYGITLDLLREIHFTYFEFNLDNYRDSLHYRCEQYLRKKSDKEIEQKINKMVNLLLGMYFQELTPDEEFNKVIQVHKCYGNYEDYVNRKEQEIADIRERRSQEQTSLPNIDNFYRSYLLDYLKQDPYLMYLDDNLPDLGTGSVDLDLLYKIGLCIFSSEDNIQVQFEFSEFMNSNQPMSSTDVVDFLNEQRWFLKKRSDHSSFAFKKIDDKLNDDFKILEKTSIVQTFKQKGDLLEDLVTRIFEEQDGFTVKKNVHRKGEEIDLIIINKISDPFWTSLQSPLILVECKNQKKRVEPKDLRNFEVKILDRKNLCRLGIVVSTSGFTGGCFEVCARFGRDGNRMILVDSNSIENRFVGTKTTVEWLEELILEQC